MIEQKIYTGDANEVKANQNIIFNIQSYTLTGRIGSYGTLKIIGTGTINKTGTNVIANRGNLTIGEEGATTGITVFSYGESYNCLVNEESGTLTINYAKVYADEITSHALLVRTGTTVNINNGVFANKGNGSSANSGIQETIDIKTGATVNIKGGTITNLASTKNTIGDAGTLNVSGGTIESKSIDYNAIYVTGEAKISNGTIKNYSKGRAVLVKGTNSKLTFSGGLITNNGYYPNNEYSNLELRVALEVGTGATVNMTGGTVENIGLPSNLTVGSNGIATKDSGQGTAARVYGTFTMTGGTITSGASYYIQDNAHKPLGSIVISNSAVVTINGGKIINDGKVYNTNKTLKGTLSPWGYRGATITIATATFNMKKGTISGENYFIYKTSSTSTDLSNIVPIATIYFRADGGKGTINGGVVENTYIKGKFGGSAIRVRNTATLKVQASTYNVRIRSYDNTNSVAHSKRYPTVAITEGGTFTFSATANSSYNSQIISWNSSKAAGDGYWYYNEGTSKGAKGAKKQ